MPFVVKRKVDAKPPWYHYRSKSDAEYCASYWNGVVKGGGYWEGHNDKDPECPWVFVWVDENKKINRENYQRACAALAEWLDNPKKEDL